MEPIIVSAIRDFAEQQNILRPEQHGFRRGHSCKSQLLGFVDEAAEAMEIGCQVDVLIMDFSKSFDRVCHSLLIHKLHQCQCKISGKINLWIEHVLLGRQETICTSGLVS